MPSPSNVIVPAQLFARTYFIPAIQTAVGRNTEYVQEVQSIVQSVAEKVSVDVIAL